ncbi:hypothetical protein MVEN_01629000 [Mycena venus]|uniref:Uncharacterized protein n=1 Tax=Mycena venus TaxID=2733690 RepID=A0A8H6XPA0_9AGAR|nr:hypothetical protein MVEN_01629000 [Mycena venus]
MKHSTRRRSSAHPRPWTPSLVQAPAPISAAVHADTLSPLFSIFAFLGFGLVLIPLPWHLKPSKSLCPCQWASPPLRCAFAAARTKSQLEAVLALCAFAARRAAFAQFLSPSQSSVVPSLTVSRYLRLMALTATAFLFNTPLNPHLRHPTYLSFTVTRGSPLRTRTLYPLGSSIHLFVAL